MHVPADMGFRVTPSSCVNEGNEAYDICNLIESQCIRRASRTTYLATRTYVEKGEGARVQQSGLYVVVRLPVDPASKREDPSTA